MAGNSIFNQPGNELIQSRMKEVTDRIRRQRYILLAFWFTVTGLLTIAYYFILDFPYFPLRNLIYALVFAAVTVSWFVNIPFIGIMILIVMRTKSQNFFFQLFPTLGLLILMTVVALSNTVELSEDSVEIVIYIGVLLILIVLEATMLRLHVQGVKNNKKPLWFWTFFQDTVESYTSAILSQQALNIGEQQNGYTQRPFFASFPEISTHCFSLDDYQSKMGNYSRFLTEKSELIGWDISGDTAVLYPRVLLGHADLGAGIRYLWGLFFRIYRKKGLTAVTIDFKMQEISLSIAKEDYEWLSNVTYHLLGQQILERFKQSIIAFIENDLDKSYSILFPRKKELLDLY